MSEIPKKGRYTFKIEQYQCNLRKMLRFSFLVNTMLSAADYHSTERGFGTVYLNQRGKTWVLSRLAVEMIRIPSRHEVVAVETWVEKVHPMFTNRNFRMTVDSTGEVLGWGRSVWAMLDTSTRHAVNLLEVNDGAIRNYVVEPDDPEYLEVPITKPVRVQGENFTMIRQLDTFFSDVDFNGHINSMRYVDHILDLFPLAWHRKNNIKRLDIAYVAEGRPEVPIRIYAEGTESSEIYAEGAGSFSRIYAEGTGSSSRIYAEGAGSSRRIYAEGTESSSRICAEEAGSFSQKDSEIIAEKKDCIAIAEEKDYIFKILQSLPENQEETEACRLRLRTVPLIP